MNRSRPGVSAASGTAAAGGALADQLAGRPRVQGEWDESDPAKRIPSPLLPGLARFAKGCICAVLWMKLSQPYGAGARACRGAGAGGGSGAARAVAVQGADPPHVCRGGVAPAHRRERCQQAAGALPNPEPGPSFPGLRCWGDMSPAARPCALAAPQTCWRAGTSSRRPACRTASSCCGWWGWRRAASTSEPRRGLRRGSQLPAGRGGPRRKAVTSLFPHIGRGIARLGGRWVGMGWGPAGRGGCCHAWGIGRGQPTPLVARGPCACSFAWAVAESSLIFSGLCYNGRSPEVRW